jgi:hypothetical protein
VALRDGIVDRIDPGTNAVAATIRVQQGPRLIAAGDGVVVVAGDGYTERIDPETGDAESIPGPQAEAGLTAGDSKVWFADYSFGGNGVNNITIKPQLFRYPRTERAAYVGTFIETNSGVGPPLPLAVGNGVAWQSVIGTNNEIRPMDTADGKPGKIITVGTYPIGLALDGIGGLWVLNQGDGTVWKISTQSRQSVAVVPVGQRVMGIAANAQGVWVTVQPAAASGT